MAQHAPSGHEKIETSNFLMIVLILLTVAVGGIVEIVPLFFQRSTTQPVEGLKPYTPLQLAGRELQVHAGTAGVGPAPALRGLGQPGA